MKAGVLYANEDIRYEDAKTPEAGKGEVVVKVKAVGICGSDVPRVLSNGAHYYPIILGHEFSGDIAQIGEGVEGLNVGDRVAGAPLVPCFHCSDCQKGNYSLCKNYTFIGSREPGAFAEYVKMPAANAIRFSNSVPYEQGAFFEPSTVALHGVKCAGFYGGEDVAVLGGGTIGMFTLQWAKIFGAKRVFVFDIVPERLELAKRLGADVVINTSGPDFKEQALRLTDGKGFGFVFETAGVTVTEQLSFELAGNKASVCFIGTPTRDLTFTPKLFENMNRKEFTLTGSWMSYSAPFPGNEWTLTAQCFSDGRLKYDDSFVYQKFPMSQIAEAFRLFQTPGAVKGKILLVNE